MGRLDRKVALISGGARGQGEAEARRFATEGARVVIGDVLDDEGKAVADDLGDACTYTRLDVTQEDSWAEAVRVAVDTFGALHVLVNNAGILGPFRELVDLPLDDFVRVITVNQVGVFLGMKHAAPAIEASGGGSIVNISSIGGLWGIPFAAAYSSSKFAVRGLTRVGALELGRRNIRVNSVHPGGVDTPMTQEVGGSEAGFYRRLPIPRVGTVDDITNVVLFLASDESAYCTGSEFVVDGGSLAGDMSLFS
ncbi:MAG: glucose 1-dehydrogenase [Acidimicrobiales bacterium]